MDNSLYLLSAFLNLVNNTPTGLFSSSRGLRQGYQLSPLLFVIVMEALSMMISIVVSGGLLSDFFLGTKNVGGIDISHFLFADDI